MKKYRFYILVVIITIIVGTFIYYFSDYSNRVKIVFSLFDESNKQKIISQLAERVDSDSMKNKLKMALDVFASKMKNNEYSDDLLYSLMEEFSRLSNLQKIDSLSVEKFFKSVNRNF